MNDTWPAVGHTWWPSGSHLTKIFGPRYAVIGSVVGVSEANGIGQDTATYARGGPPLQEQDASTG